MNRGAEGQTVWDAVRSLAKCTFEAVLTSDAQILRVPAAEHDCLHGSCRRIVTPVMGRGGAGERDGKARGELGELRSQLMALSGGGSSPERINQKRELFRKIIMSGTIGQDMSGLFMQVPSSAALSTRCASIPRAPSPPHHPASPAAYGLRRRCGRAAALVAAL